MFLLCKLNLSDLTFPQSQVSLSCFRQIIGVFGYDRLRPFKCWFMVYIVFCYDNFATCQTQHISSLSSFKLPISHYNWQELIALGYNLSLIKIIFLCNVYSLRLSLMQFTGKVFLLPYLSMLNLLLWLDQITHFYKIFFRIGNLSIERGIIVWIMKWEVSRNVLS